MFSMKNNIKNIILNAISDKERGYGELEISVAKDALEFIADASGGDARIALNALELSNDRPNCRYAY